MAMRIGYNQKVPRTFWQWGTFWRGTSAIFLVLIFLESVTATAAIDPTKVHVADVEKNNSYIQDGMVVGGDRAINEVVIHDIRRAMNSGFERIVLDLEGTRNGEPAAIPRPPYYQVAVSPDRRQLVLSVWGSPKLSFDSKKIVRSFKRSPYVKQVELYPVLNDEVWTTVLHLKEDRPVEVFELADPVRLIVDIRSK